MATLDVGGDVRVEPSVSLFFLSPSLLCHHTSCRMTMCMWNKILMWDQLKEYTDQGEALDGYSFLDYFLDTYDGEEVKVPAVVDEVFTLPCIPIGIR